MANKPMIVLNSVTKTYGRWNETTTVLNGVNVTFEPKKHYVIFGQPGSGKSTLLQLVSGLQWPTTGSIERQGVVAPPLGSMAMLTLSNTVRGVVAFAADLYRISPSTLLDFVVRFAELYDHLETPIRNLPAIDRVALSYAIGYGVPADVYLIDGSPVGGRDSVRRRCERAFEERRAGACTIFATRNGHTFKLRDEYAAILHGGELITYRDQQKAIDAFSAMEIDARHGTLSAAEFMTRSGDLSGAVEYLEDYVSINSEDLGGHKMLANLALRTQNFAAAKEALQAVVDLTPHDKEAYLALARTAEREEDWETAASQYAEYLKLDPGNLTIFAALARAYEKLEQPSAAARIWHRIFAESDNLAEATAAIRACIRLRDWEATFRMLDYALEQWPRDMTLLTMSARICLQLVRPEDFTDTLLRMSEVDLPAAMARASGAVAQMKAHNIVAFLTGLRGQGLLSKADKEGVKRLLGQLERYARLADKESRPEEARQIRDEHQILKAAV